MSKFENTVTTTNYFCDGCGEESPGKKFPVSGMVFPPTGWGHPTFRGHLISTMTRLDLCPDCLSGFEAWAGTEAEDEELSS